MMGPVGPFVKQLFSRVAGAVSGRHVSVLAREARDERLILDLRAPYRVADDVLTIDLLEPEGGKLRATLLGYVGPFPSRTLWTSAPHSYDGPCRFQFNLATGDVTLDGANWGRADVSGIRARFCWRFTRTGPQGTATRLTSHYRANRPEDHGEAYYSGDNYLDYEDESSGQRVQILDLMEKWRAGGPLLEVGCATGSLLVDIEARYGIAGLGLDVSEWAVGEATKKLGPNRVWAIDLERDPMPETVQRAGPFGTIIMFSVLEHLRDPQASLAALTRLSARGTLLLLETTNADSLSHRIFGSDWEGYFDRTHMSVDSVSVRTVPAWLEALGWRVVERRTRLLWDRSADPTHHTLRDWWAADARFRRLLAERDLGDLVFCVAIKS
ncbi:MAG: class I SAM-dependent methyltransferase [Acidobacteriia bacterium]|nr:class I SAM-dependent methyltransferase [Terriglobia bacterium]